MYHSDWKGFVNKIENFRKHVIHLSGINTYDNGMQNISLL